MQKSKFKLVLYLLSLLLLAAACSGSPETPEEGDMIDTRGEEFIATAEELAQFFTRGPQSAILTDDINMGQDMLKLTAGRGNVTLYGNGHAINSSASCAIRLDSGCAITLDDVVINAEQTALGLLGDGEVGGNGLVITAGINAIHAAGNLKVSANSNITLTSETGMGIKAEGAAFLESVVAEISASTYAIRADRGGVLLGINCDVLLSAYGDNCLFSEGDLELGEDSTLRSNNIGEHNAVLVASLKAHPTALLEATGGINGMGLFIMEQYESVTLKGFSKPEVMLEAGDGEVIFQN